MSEADRCGWCTSDALYVQYHDEEWGVPERDATALFERLVLEGMQAGLSWWTVLKKRERMREQFFGFAPQALVEEGPARMADWLADAGLIRHEGKLEAMISNAQAFLQMDDFSDFVWSAVDHRPIVNRFETMSEVPAHTAAAKDFAKRLKKAGFRFVGPTTVYAFMQSAGLVNDHVTTCPWHARCAALAEGFPG